MTAAAPFPLRRHSSAGEAHTLREQRREDRIGKAIALAHGTPTRRCQTQKLPRVLRSFAPCAGQDARGEFDRQAHHEPTSITIALPHQPIFCAQAKKQLVLSSSLQSSPLTPPRGRCASALVHETLSSDRIWGVLQPPVHWSESHLLMSVCGVRPCCCRLSLCCSLPVTALHLPFAISSTPRVTTRPRPLALLSTIRPASPRPAMSQANKQTPGQADEGSVASRTRRQTRMRARDEGDEKEQHSAPSSAHVSPASRIYRHALEAILGMLTLGELIRILAVSREWSAAVRSMKPINAALGHDPDRSVRGRKAPPPLPPIESIAASPLLRHLATIEICDAGGSWTSLNTVSLRLLAQHVPHLTSLRCELTLTPNAPLILPAKLVSLNVTLDGNYTDATINGMLAALAALSSLSRLRLELSAFANENALDLSILAACQSLTGLILAAVRRVIPAKLTSVQVDQIRVSLGHLHHFSVEWMGPDVLARFVQLPCTAQWRDIGRLWSDVRAGELLLRLPSLTKIHLTDVVHVAHVDFLQQLPLLTSLSLDCCLGGAQYIPADTLVAALLRCIA